MSDLEFNIYAVKDELTETFMQPVFVKTEAEIQRIFKHQVNSIPLWKSNASDYSLYKLGKFNEYTGHLIPELKKIVSGHTVITEDKE